MPPAQPQPSVWPVIIYLNLNIRKLETLKKKAHKNNGLSPGGEGGI